MKSVFEYADYRKYLLDYYSEKKAANRNFSHRFIANRVGFKSGGHFSLILKGKANISIAFIQRLAGFLKLNKKEAGYFQNMVLFNQAKRHDDKKRYFEAMLSYKDALVRVVHADQYDFYDKWYYTALRELLAIYPLCDPIDHQAVGRLLNPPIPAAEVRQAFDLLKRLALINRDASGRYRPTDPFISTGYSATSISLNNFVINTLDLVKQSVDRFSKEDRNFSWIAFSLSRQSLQSIIDELRESRRRIMKIVENDPNPERVYLFASQIFPLSNVCPNKGASV
jgi:uncharacterized protein (TIGR02147 family)